MAKNIKLAISLDEELLKRTDKAAEQRFMTRSGLIATALGDYLLQDEIRRAVVSLAVAMHKIADNGKIDKDTKEQLKQFEAIAKVINSGGF